MQPEAQKTVANYNEFRGLGAPDSFSRGHIDVRTEPNSPTNGREIATKGIQLVNHKVKKILGESNKLTREDLVFPRIKFIATDPSNPNWAGYYTRDDNEITLVLDKIKNDPREHLKVFIHEYLHFLSHNGRDTGEQVNSASPLAERNNVGFQRDFGLDIRKGKEGQMTHHYFLAFDEAVTEQLTIDIHPEGYNAYNDYRGLLNQVIDDAVAQKFGSKNKDGVFIPWSRQQFKNYVYACFFKGDLNGFTSMLRGLYGKYGISEQQFGLMTHRDDLPSVIEAKLKTTKPNSPPPAPSQVAAMVQERLDNKVPEDYITDVNPEPVKGGDGKENIYGKEYDDFIEKNKIEPASTVTVQGKQYQLDSQRLYVYSPADAPKVFDYIKKELDKLLIEMKGGKITRAEVTEQIDELLFERYRVSMLSPGFREFYIYKHEQMASL